MREIMQYETMDNQHTNSNDLAYLAGIIDGEGCVTIERTGARRKGTNDKNLQPSITITNTDANLINHCQSILDKFKIGNYIKSQTNRMKKNWKPCYWLAVKGLNKVHKLIWYIEPYIVAKKGQVQLVKKFIESRGLMGAIQKPKGKKYSDSERALIKDVHELNRRGVRDCRLASE